MARIRPAKHYQRKDSAVRLLADYGRNKARPDFKASLKQLPTMVPTKRAVELARAGLWYRLKDEIAWDHFREILKAPFGRLGKTFEAGASLGVQRINGAFARRGKQVRFGKAAAPSSRFNFDLYSRKTQDYLRGEQDRLIGDLTAQARNTIDLAIISGAQNGYGPEEIVGDIRSVIGLSEPLAQAALNYQQMLYDLDPDALQRRLRNTAMDQDVQDAIDAGIPLEDAQIDALLGDYVDNALDYRAWTIAQTESVRAANAGLQDSYQQAVDRGALPSDAVTRNWRVALDERTCPVCLSIPDMNPDGVAIDEQFDSIDGPVDNPPIHPNCRCEVEMVTDLDQVPDDAFADDGG